MDIKPTTQTIAFCPTCKRGIHIRYTNPDHPLTMAGLGIHDLTCDT